MGFKYETHMHCHETSGCAHNTGAEMADYYKSLGYTGVIVTDHIHPSGKILPEEAWAAETERITAGYRACRKRGDEIGLDVFYGWEYSAGWTHYLILGLGCDWHRDKPEEMTLDIGAYLDRVHADGAFVIHAHPFREGVEPVLLYPSRTDAVEVLSAARIDSANAHALEFANGFSLPHCAGSDCHAVNRSRLCGVETAERVKNVSELAALIASGDCELFDERYGE